MSVKENKSTTDTFDKRKNRDRTYRDLWSRPGFFIRRLHQIHVGLWADECQGENLTPIQFGMLSVLSSGEAMDQLTLSTYVGVDRVSGADVIRRLKRRGFLEINPSERDKRAKNLQITDLGRQIVERVRPRMIRVQAKLVSPLTEQELEEFERLIKKLIKANNTASRAPMGRA